MMKQLLLAAVLSLHSMVVSAFDDTYIAMLLDAYDIKYYSAGHPICEYNLAWGGFFSPKNKILALCMSSTTRHLTLKHELVHVAQWCKNQGDSVDFLHIPMMPLTQSYAEAYASDYAANDPRFDKGSLHYFLEMEAEGVAVSTPLCEVIRLVQERCIR